jgi:hypothetical protein
MAVKVTAIVKTRKDVSAIVRNQRYITAKVSGFVRTVGVGGSAIFETGETPSGTINGSNATFTSAHAFVPESLEVFLNGLRQKLVSDYVSTGGTTIVFSISPTVGDSISINYQRS